MKDIEKKAFLFHAESASFKKKEEQAKLVIDNAFKVSDKWYIALSGGKDSTVVFDLVRSKEKNILSMWSDEEFFLPETKAYIDRLMGSGSNIKRIKGAITHTDWFISNKYLGEKGKTETAQEMFLEGVFLGLRAEENKRRRIYLSKFGLLYYANNRKLWQCNPIGWWNVKDVWAYIISHNIDYNKAYDKLGGLGLSFDKQRIGPFATDRALGYGQLAILKMGWPDEYQRFVAKFPEAVRYT